MSDESYWLHFHNGKEIQTAQASPFNDSVLVRLEHGFEWTITFGSFEESGDGTYGWQAVAPPGERWTLDRKASASKDFRVAYWRRPRAQVEDAGLRR